MQRPKPAFALLLSLAGLAGAARAAQEPTKETDHQGELNSIVERYEQARSDWMKELVAASDEERTGLFDLEPRGEYLEEFQELADRAVGSEVAGRAWLWVAKLARQDDAEIASTAARILVEDYADAAFLAELPPILHYGGAIFGEELCNEGLRAMIADSPHGDVRANALYVLAHRLADGGEHADEARGLFQRLAREHADGKDARGRSWGKLAEGGLNALDRLRVGQVAPDIEGTDTSGVAFKLSDYRGKVVLLDFWGHW